MHRTFTFKNNLIAIKFLDKVRNSCNELDHHPEWNLNNNILDVKLTSHFNKNNVSEKDYRLASLLSVQYDEYCGYTNQTYLSYLIGASIILGISFASIYYYNLVRNYRITSMDFVFARIETKDNAYVKKSFSKYI